MNCGNCGGVVKAGGKFCPHCGSAVAAAPPVVPAPTRLGAAEPAPPPTTRYCMTCGGAVGANQAKCHSCGAPLAAPVASGPRKTRLAAPIEASYEAVGSAPVPSPGAAAPRPGAPRPGAATPTRVQAPPAIIKGSNRTFYQLLGLAFLLIACAYVGYHYWSAPPAPETRRAEGPGPGFGELSASGEPAQDSSAEGYTQSQPGDEYQAQSAPPAGWQQAALNERQPSSSTFGTAGGTSSESTGGTPGGSLDRRAEAPGQYQPPAPQSPLDPGASRRPSSRTPSSSAMPRTPARGVNRPPSPPLAGTLTAEARAPRNMANPPPAPLAVESRTPAKATLPSARPREPVPVEPVTPKDPSSAGAGQAPPQQGGPQQGGKVLLPGSQAWRVPPKKTAPADLPTQTAAASPPPRLVPRPPAPPPQVRTEGIIYWTGKLKKNQTIVIDGAEATVGFADGNLLPGSAVEVHIPSPAVQLVEHPTPRNGWKRVAFRCLRSTKRSVTLNIQWKVR